MKSISLSISIFMVLAACPALAQTKACAHRGDMAVAPENTLPAIQLAVDKGAAMIEFDVRRTADGHLVLMHDSTVDRTTDGTGPIEEMDLESVRKLDAGSWFSPDFVGVQAPTLEEALAIIPRTILCNVHLKGDADLGRDVALALKKMDRLDHCFLASTPDQFATARAAVPEIKICHMGRRTDRESYIEAAIAAQVDFVQLHHRNGTEGLAESVAKLHDAGITVNWFGAQEEELIRTLAEAKVDYILTDDLDLCLKVLAEYAAEQEAQNTREAVSAAALRRPSAVNIDERGALSQERDMSAPWAFRHKVLVGEACPCPEHLGAIVDGATAAFP